MVISLVVISLLIPLFLLIGSTMIQKSSESAFLKTAPFECGFEEFSSARLSFSMKFFLVVLVFLIFDVEVALVLPLPIGSALDLVTWLKVSAAVMGVLLAGVALEASQGSLAWVE